MLVVSLLSWWYTAGWAQLARRSVLRVAGVLEFFSVGMLAGSLFAPFRQISAGKVRGSLDTQMRAWADRQISRGIGAMVRLAVILFGLVATLLMAIVAAALLALWPFVPVMPLVVVFVVTGLQQ